MTKNPDGSLRYVDVRVGRRASAGMLAKTGKVEVFMNPAKTYRAILNFERTGKYPAGTYPLYVVPDSEKSNGKGRVRDLKRRGQKKAKRNRSGPARKGKGRNTWDRLPGRLMGSGFIPKKKAA